MPEKLKLKLDWATHDSAKYACENWHYSKCLPVGRSVKIGVWEDSRFVGVIFFSCGASPPMYVWARVKLGLDKYEICELTRIALREHKTPVSRMMKVAIKFLLLKCPNIKVIVSFADMDENHHGGIYQAGNWVYIGVSNQGARQGYMIFGKKTHCRSVGAKTSNSLKGAKKIDPNAFEIRTKGKHKYLYFIDNKLKTKVSGMIKPYPKRAASIDSDASVNHTEEGGANPTAALQFAKPK